MVSEGLAPRSILVCLALMAFPNSASNPPPVENLTTLGGSGNPLSDNPVWPGNLGKQ